MTPFEAYREYTALKRHFQDAGYDYVKFQGKLRGITPQSFERRNDRYLFSKLSRHHDASFLIVANLVENPNMWVGEILENEHRYYEHRKKVEALTHTVTQELKYVHYGFDQFIRPGYEAYPPIIDARLSGDISHETFATVINLARGIVAEWTKEYPNDPVIERLSMMALKYYPFLQVDEKRVSRAIISSFKKVDTRLPTVV